MFSHDMTYLFIILDVKWPRPLISLKRELLFHLMIFFTEYCDHNIVFKQQEMIAYHSFFDKNEPARVKNVLITLANILSITFAVLLHDI